MRLIRCDVCEAVAELGRPGWRELTIQRARGWSPGFTSDPDYPGVAMSAEDTWPGYERWFGYVGPLKIEVCSEACMFAALTKLHTGSRVVDFGGFSIPSEALIATLRESEPA